MYFKNLDKTINKFTTIRKIYKGNGITFVHRPTILAPTIGKFHKHR